MDLEAPLLSNGTQPEVVKSDAGENTEIPDDLDEAQAGFVCSRGFIGWSLFFILMFLFSHLFGLYFNGGGTRSVAKVMSAGAVAQIDYTLRPTAATTYCVASDGVKSGSRVGLKSCEEAAPEQSQFDLKDDGTVHLMSDLSLCLAVSSGQFQLETCSGSLKQLWRFEVAGTFELRSQSDQCMNVLKDDFQGGQLGLYPCEEEINTVFAYGGGHFLVPGLVHDANSMLSQLSGIAAWNLPQAIVWFLLIVLLIAAVCRWDANPKFALTVCNLLVIVYIVIIAGIQCYSLLYLRSAFEFIISDTQANDKFKMDYSLRMSEFPDHCMTVFLAAPSSEVSMQSCRDDDDLQKFLLQTSNGKLEMHLLSRPELCVGLEDQKLLLDSCGKVGFEKAFSDPQGSGGSLPLAHTSSCLGLVDDIGSGTLGFNDCTSTIKQIFVYGKGNPSVARLLHRIHAVSDRMDDLSGNWPLTFVRRSYLSFGACLLAFWLLLKFAGLVANVKSGSKVVVIPKSIRSGFRPNKKVVIAKHSWQTPSQRLKEAMTTARKTKPLTADTVETLETHIDMACKDGVTGELIEKANTLLSEIKLRVSDVGLVAAEELTEAVYSKDIKAIAPCLEACRCLGANEAIAQHLPVIAPLLEAEMDQAARMDRTERRESLPAMEQILLILREFSHPVAAVLHSRMIDLKGSLRVLCRVRPMSASEAEAGNNPIVVTPHNHFSVSVTVPKKTAVSETTTSEIFSYDSVFLENSSQADVFSEARHLIQSAFDGYNISIFAYGQTGAGKTYTLYGIPNHAGLAPRTCDEVFRLIALHRDTYDVCVKASMVELYNDELRDLLSMQKVPPKIDIRTATTEVGMEVARLDCTELQVESAAALKSVVDHGFGQRKVASTISNATSSRSHLLLIIHLQITDKASGRTRTGKITVGDLAGCERIKKSLNISGYDLSGEIKKEAIKINSSLTALCDVMSALTSGMKMIPYRNHKLTMLMQDSLGGSAKTLMFVNISPCKSNAEETLNALRYASRARTIENDVKKERRGNVSNSTSPHNSHPSSRASSPRIQTRPLLSTSYGVNVSYHLNSRQGSLRSGV